MLNRRQLLKRALHTSPLLALGSTVPQFLARTAQAAAATPKNRDKILVVVELTGGNDGLNMVVPYGDDLYQKARPTLGIKKDEVIRIDDLMGLNPALKPLEKMLGDHQLATLQGVGYPNPNRSHSEAMDIWHTADPRGRSRAGWLGQAIGLMPLAEGKIPALGLGDNKLPLALQGAPGGVPNVNPNQEYGLELSWPQFQNDSAAKPAPPPPVVEKKTEKSEKGAAEKAWDPYAADATGDAARKARLDAIAARKRLIHDLTAAAPDRPNSMAQFARRTALETFSTVDRLNELLATARRNGGYFGGNLTGRLQLIARMIQADFGARVYFASLGSFDTHGNQRPDQDKLLGELADALQRFFADLNESGNADRVVLLTFSEFGRRVHENDSHGTDHGAASSLFLAGPRVKGGLIGKHPSLANLEDGDLRFHTDFRSVYATILEDWLHCDSRRVLGEKFDRLPLFRA